LGGRGEARGCGERGGGGAGGAAGAGAEVKGVQEGVPRLHVVLLPDEARIQARLYLLRLQERGLDDRKVLLVEQALREGLLCGPASAAWVAGRAHSER